MAHGIGLSIREVYSRLGAARFSKTLPLFLLCFAPLMAFAAEVVTLTDAVLLPPEADFPFLHLQSRVAIAGDVPLALTRVGVDGDEVRGSRWIGTQGILRIPIPWQARKSYSVDVTFEDAKKGELHATISAKAPSKGGIWNPNWKYYASVVLSDTGNIGRKSAPVHVTLALYADRVTDVEREIRVVRLDTDTGQQVEVPSQVYAVTKWIKPPDDEKYEPGRFQSTVNCEVAFLADVPAGAKRIYLIYYGNPTANKPDYRTDLRVSGADPGLTIENAFYNIKLHEKSGVLDEIRMQGSAEVFAHHIETNGAVHWNPGCYAPPDPWVHASDWDPPAGMGTIKGPIFVMAKRWGPLPHLPHVFVSITYIFYSNNPYLIMSSVLRMDGDAYVKALRNGEIVLNHDVVDSFAWEDHQGKVHLVAVAEVPQHPVHGLEIEPDTPWVALLSPRKRIGFAGITLEFTNARVADGLPRVEQPYIYLEVGRWVYWARALAYPFGSQNPQRLVFVPKGSLYLEKNAYMPFKLGDKPESRFSAIQNVRTELMRPLAVSVHVDIDKRVPGEWVWPTLTAPFQEIIQE